MNPSWAAVAVFLLAAPLFSQDISPEALSRAAPDFGKALIEAAKQTPAGLTPEHLSLLDEAARSGALPRGATTADLARAYLEKALSAPQDLDRACLYLDGLGPEGQEAEARLRGPRPPRSPTASAVKEAGWDESGSRHAFDNAAPSAGAVAVPAGGTRQPPGLSPNLPDVLAKPPPPGTVKIVAVGWGKLQDLARKQVYQERKAGFEQAYGIRPGENLGGGGAFMVKILDAKEVAADPVKQGVRDEASKKGEKVVFVRTTAKVQLFGSQGIPIPIEVPAGGLSASAGVGLSLGGAVEIVETRAVPADKAGALEHAEKRVFLWPLTAEHLKSIMRVGEDLTITGRVQAGASVSLGAGAGLGLSSFAQIGESVGAGSGSAADRWVTLHIKKVDEDHVRILVQKGGDETLSANISASAGLNLNADTLIPTITPSKVEDGLLGRAVIGGEKSILKQVQDLFSTSLAASWGAGKNDVAAEGWASVSLSDQKSAAALDALFKFKPEAMRGLSPEATFSGALKAGHLTADVRDVTHNASFLAHLSKLKITLTDGTAYYELRWKADDGQVKHYLVGIANSRFHGDVTKTNRAEESVMWYDLDSKKATVTVSLGPQDRLFTTTREKINDVIATQKAMGGPIQGWVKEPSPYLQFFGLANYGRSEEKGSFLLTPDGVDALKTVGREDLVASYLHADWLYENESWAPGTHFWNAKEPPPWSRTQDPKALAPVLDFLRRHAADVRSMQGDKNESSRLSRLEREYERLAPGRYLREDAWRYIAAAAYSNRVVDMQKSGNPEGLVEMFLKLRKDGAIDLKRAVVATAGLAGEGNWRGHIQMTGTRVELKPAGAAPSLPAHPVGQLNAVLAGWQ